MNSMEMSTPRESMASHQSRQSTAFESSEPPTPKHRLEGHGERRTSTETATSRSRSGQREAATQPSFTYGHRAPMKDRPGWPRLAELMAHTPEFAAFPRFRELNTRNLLYYQVELQLLQRQIELQEEDDKLNIERYDELVEEGDSAYHSSLLKLRVLLREYSTSLVFNFYVRSVQLTYKRRR